MVETEVRFENGIGRHSGIFMRHKFRLCKFSLVGRNNLSLINDIIVEATSKEGDVPRMLRLCLVLAARLNHDPLKNWARSELNGYSVDLELPKYRKFRTRNRGRFHSTYVNGVLDVPISLLPEKLRPHYEIAEMRDSIGEYVHLLSRSDDGGEMCIYWSPELALQYASKLIVNGQCISAWMEISTSELAGMVDQIKSMVLGFALDIEAEAPDVGEITGPSLAVSEQKVTQIFNTNIAGGLGALQTGYLATANLSETIDEK